MNSVRFRFRRRIGAVFVLLLLFALQSLATPHYSAASLPGGYYPVWMGPRPYGGFADPAAASVDASGNVYVADTANHRIKKLSPHGEALAVWGSRGGGPGHFEFPSGIAVHPDGRIFVADTWNHRVQIFDARGKVLGQWASAGGLSMSFPTGIAIDSSGAVYVSDTMNHRVLKFSSAGELMTTIGTPGLSGWGAGQFSSPHGLAVDDAHLYVADTNNQRIQKFTPGGAFLRQWGWVDPVDGRTFSRYGSPLGIAVAGPNLILVSGNIRNPPLTGPVRHLERTTTTGTPHVQWGGTGDGAGLYQTPRAIVARPGGGAYVVDSGNNRIQLIQLLNDPPWQSAPEIWSGAGSAPGELNAPSSAKVGSGGLIYVADTGNNRIQVFNADRTHRMSFGGSGITSRPADIAIAANGDVWVADSGESRVVRFSAAGSFIASIGVGQVRAPQGVAIDASGHVWVADTGNARLKEFSQQGAVLRTIGGFTTPVDVEVDTRGRLWVVDRDAHKVFVLEESTGVRITSFGGFGELNGQFRLPMGLAISPAGHVYVSDGANGRVQRFSSAGIWESSIGSPGAGSGQMRRPMRPAVLPDGMLLVPERDNHRLHLFAHVAAPPAGTFVLNAGARFTAMPTVVASSTITGATEARFDTGFGFGPWGPLLPSQTLLLLPGEGVREAHAQYRNVAGNILSLSDTITVDWTPPVTTAHGIPEGPVSHSVSVSFTATDAISGVASIFVRVGNAAFAPYLPGQPITIHTQGETRLQWYSSDLAGNMEAIASAIVTITPLPKVSVEITRVAGLNRYQTALEVSRAMFSQAATVVVSTGESFPDALAASSLAGALNAPVLLTLPDRLPPGTIEEIRRLGARHVYLIGGSGAVRDHVADELRAVGLSVTRIGGKDRFETAAKVSARTVAIRGSVPNSGTVFIVRGDDFADGVSVSSAAWASRIPVLLVRPEAVPSATSDAIASQGFSRAVVVGGTGAVSDDAANSLGIAVYRVPGVDRYATSAAFARWAHANSILSFRHVGLATGVSFPDALSGGAGMGVTGGVLLLTRVETLPPVAHDTLGMFSADIRRVTVFGGERAVEGSVVHSLSVAFQ